MGRREKLAQIARSFAADDSHGYSQRPPSGRWGPDYDCSSFLYEVATLAGYDVGRGGDKVRYTGTMTKDFKDAGFQLLPFANVGLGDLKIGDILLNLAVHAEVYVGEGKLVGAEQSENGGYSGIAGDQTGEEISEHDAYILNKGWDFVLRPPEEPDEEYIENEEEYIENEEDGENMPYPNNMGMPAPYNGGWQPSRSTVGWTPGNYTSINGGYPQGGQTQINGYPQNTMGSYPQSGYGQAYQNGYPQGGQQSAQLQRVNGLEGARDIHVGPNSVVPLFDANEPYLYLKSTDQEGFPSIRVFELRECSEEMASGHPGAEQVQNGHAVGGQAVSREEFDKLKEMIENVQSTISGGSGFPQGNAQQSTAKTNGQPNTNRSARNS